MFDSLSEGLKDLKDLKEFSPVELITRIEKKVDNLVLTVERVEKLLIYYKPLVDFLRKIPFLKS